jgi:hypothetical protein
MQNVTHRTKGFYVLPAQYGNYNHDKKHRQLQRHPVSPLMRKDCSQAQSQKGGDQYEIREIRQHSLIGGYPTNQHHL